jgi:4-hydroxy-2-oxoheptanedioate aldolase
VTAPDRFAERLRAGEELVGYWIACDNPVGTERIAGLGYDYIGIDGQHGVHDVPGWRAALTAIDARGVSAGVIRVPSADPVQIGVALDIGARAVIVPMVDDVEEAEVAVRACRHHPAGTRSFGGPVRAELRTGSTPAEIDAEVACIVMIETAAALEAVDEICAVRGLDAVYVGPADLCVSLGGEAPDDPAMAVRLAAALSTVVGSATAAGIACGIHCLDGATAAKRLAEGFTFVTVSSDLTHLESAAAAHLAEVRR